jgi:heme A synthase
METATERTERGGSGGAGSAARSRAGLLALVAAVYTYALVVFGGIVRITGSGMGCGEDWPRCNGQWIPAFTFETTIEYTHRLLAAGIGIVVLGVLGYAFMKRSTPGMAGRGGLLRPFGLAAALFVLQALLGAVTVRLELPTHVTVAHFIMAMLFIATLIVAAVRAGVFGEVGSAVTPDPLAKRAAMWAFTTAAVGLIVVAFGAVTANTPGSPPACTGFPLCSGSLLPPAGAVPAEIHWAHRVAAFTMLFVSLAAALAAHRARSPSPVRRAAWTAVGLIIAQLVVAAVLVLMALPPALQALHLAVGAAVWFALVVWSAQARRAVRGMA